MAENRKGPKFDGTEPYEGWELAMQMMLLSIQDDSDKRALIVNSLTPSTLEVAMQTYDHTTISTATHTRMLTNLRETYGQHKNDIMAKSDLSSNYQRNEDAGSWILGLAGDFAKAGSTVADKKAHITSHCRKDLRTHVAGYAMDATLSYAQFVSRVKYLDKETPRPPKPRKDRNRRYKGRRVSEETDEESDYEPTKARKAEPKIVCYECGKDHYKRNCPDWKKKEREKYKARLAELGHTTDEENNEPDIDIKDELEN